MATSAKSKAGGTGSGSAKKPDKKAAGKKPRGVSLEATSLGPTDLLLASPPPEVAALADAIRGDGGAVLSVYREPLGGHPLVLAALPIEQVSPTPFQRDVSEAHVKKLTYAMDKTRRFLDPIIAVREGAGASPT